MKYLAGLLTALVLAGCVPAPAPETVSAVAPPPLPHEFYRNRQEVTQLNAEILEVYIKVGKTGSLANLGHEHALQPGELEGYVYWPEDTTEARADIQFRLQDLEVDTAAAKAAVGVENDLDDQQKSDTRANMLKSLEADDHPIVRVQFSDIEPGEIDNGASWRARAIIWLHGTRRSYPVTLTSDAADASGPTSGKLTFRQTQFGIQPFSALNGGLQVSDELSVHFRFVPQEKAQSL